MVPARAYVPIRSVTAEPPGPFSRAPAAARGFEEPKQSYNVASTIRRVVDTTSSSRGT
jgi:hypothetical protein